jgi:DNA-directed RNA polymerase specialized sigma24 family protein
VYSIAWNKLDRIPDTDDRALRWLFRVALWVLWNTRRRTAHQVQVRERLRHEGTYQGDGSQEGSDRALIVEAYLSLSRDDRRVLGLLATRGMSMNDLADELGCSYAAALVRASRARQRLRNAIDM